jgi:esterase/lipase
MYLNNRVKDKKDIPVSSVTLFAPYPINNGILASFKRGISLDKTMSEQEKSQKMQTIDNMLPLTQQLFDAVKNIDYKVMGQYKFPWYLVAGSRDEIAPAQNVNNIVNTVNKPNVIGITVPGNHNLSSVKTVQKQLIINTLHFLLNTKKTM